MTTRLKFIDPGADPRWGDLVLAHPLGCIYHHSAWAEVLRSALGYQSCYIALESSDGGRFEGGLPLALVRRHIPNERRLVSLPLTAYCPPLLSPPALDEAISQAMDRHSVDSVELRLLGEDGAVPAAFDRRQLFVTHIVDLTLAPEDLLRSFHDTSVRQRIKRVERNRLSLRLGSDEKDLRAFYRLWTRVRKKHGLPPQPYGFFQSMWRVLKPKNLLSLPMIDFEGKTIAAALVLHFRDSVHFEYSAADAHYARLNPNHKLIWETMKMAKRGGAVRFDFGRTSLTNDSLLAFKDRWGAKRVNLVYSRFPPGAPTEVERGLAYKLLTSVNRRLPDGWLQLEGKLLYQYLHLALG